MVMITNRDAPSARLWVIARWSEGVETWLAFVTGAKVSYMTTISLGLNESIRDERLCDSRSSYHYEVLLARRSLGDDSCSLAHATSGDAR